MAFSITEFRASLGYGGEPANPTNYEVEITQQPRSLALQGGGFANSFPYTMRFRCESCSLPSKNMKVGTMTSYGPPIKVVYATEYSDTSFTFIATDNMEEKEYLALWQQSIINNDFTGGFEQNNVTYYEDYIGVITITHFNKIGEPTYRVTFHECFPVLVQETPMSWNSNNDYIRVTINLTYKYFVEERLFLGGVAWNRWTGAVQTVGNDRGRDDSEFRTETIPAPVVRVPPE
jgi:hypothetical protein